MQTLEVQGGLVVWQFGISSQAVTCLWGSNPTSGKTEYLSLGDLGC